jgi:NAD(P)H-dependent FMN reductase
MADGGDQERASGRSLVLGYAAGGVAVLLATIAVVAMIASIADGSGDDDVVAPDPRADVTVRETENLLPDKGLFKVPEDVDDVDEGAAAADCELKSFKANSNEHVTKLDGPVHYLSDPPTSGRHDPVPAEDGAYSVAPDVQQLVHTLEHSRVIVWFKPDLPTEARASLKAYYDHDSQLMVLVPDTSMEYAVAATAWNRKPGRYGTGRLLGCAEYSGDVFTALEAFKKANRGKGPELVP